MSSTTLLSHREAKYYTKEQTFPTCDMADIRKVERLSFNAHDFLGDALREALLADMVDYSAVVKYDSTKVDYVIDDLVLHTDGFIYKALINAPTKEPGCSTDWALADKFTTDCYNKLWCEYSLAEYLSRKLLLRSMPSVMMKLTGHGLVQDRGQDYSQATQSDRDWWLNDQKHKIQECLMDIEKYITKTNKVCFEALLEDTCDDQEFDADTTECCDDDRIAKVKKGPWNFL